MEAYRADFTEQEFLRWGEERLSSRPNVLFPKPLPIKDGFVYSLSRDGAVWAGVSAKKAEELVKEGWTAHYMQESSDLLSRIKQPEFQERWKDAINRASLRKSTGDYRQSRTSRLFGTMGRKLLRIAERF